MHTKTTRLSTSDGRTLYIAETGHPDGIPVFFHGGTPGSHVFFAPWVEDANAHRLRLISHDRPGFGDSTALPGRSVASVAADVAEIAAHLRLNRLVTVGASGGGPHALACAALLPNLVKAAITMASPAPFDATGLDWFAGMDESGATEFRAAAKGRAALAEFVNASASGIMATSRVGMAAGMRSMAQSQDTADMMERIGEWFYDASHHGLKHGNDGWLDDDLAFCAPWGFDVSKIRVPVLLLHGERDTLVPVSHGHWLADTITGVDARFFTEDDHGTVFASHFREAREWFSRKLK